jgi:N-acyl-D-aspartate/D-glutamate deacylase
MFKLGEPANYEPDPEMSFESLANSSNMTAKEIAYDAMLEKDGRALIYHPLFNYQTGDLSLVEKMLKHPYTVSGKLASLIAPQCAPASPRPETV